MMIGVIRRAVVAPFDCAVGIGGAVVGKIPRPVKEGAVIGAAVGAVVMAAWWLAEGLEDAVLDDGEVFSREEQEVWDEYKAAGNGEPWRRLKSDDTLVWDGLRLMPQRLMPDPE